MGATKNVAANIFDNVKTVGAAPVKPVNETLEQKVARLEAENAALLAKKGGFKAGTVTMKIGDGHETTYKGETKKTKVGNVSLYGIQRMPITLWANQWATLLDVLTGAKKIHMSGIDGDFAFQDLLVAGIEKGLITTEKE